MKSLKLKVEYVNLFFFYRLGLSKDNVHACVVQFSYNTEIALRLTETYDIGVFKQKVMNLRLHGKTTHMDTAIKKVRDELMTASQGLLIVLNKEL